MKITLYSEEPSQIEQSRQQVVRDAEDFERRYLEQHPEAGNDGVFSRLFYDLKNGAFWRVISVLDGRSPRFCLNFVGPAPAVQEDAGQARAFAHKSFDEAQLEQLINICANMAVLVPYQTPWPGSYKGHSIFMREVVDKKGSIFGEAVDESFFNRCVNYCFWEELSDMWQINHGLSYRCVEEMLVDYYDRFDVRFAKKGFSIYYRNLGSNPPHFDLSGISRQGIERWVDFAKRIDAQRQALGIEEADIAQLIRPYVIELMAVDSCTELVFPDFKERLQDAVVRRYCSESGLIRVQVAEKLCLDAAYSECRDLERITVEFLSAFPDGGLMANEILSSPDLYYERRLLFSSILAKRGFVFDEKSEELLAEAVKKRKAKEKAETAVRRKRL
jgi:hypothetical protein